MPRPATDPRARPLALVVVALGGVVGAAARDALATIAPVRPGRFPWATFTTNVTGCAVVGLVLTGLVVRWPQHALTRAFVCTGVLGGFTTFSTFTVEAGLLVRDGHAATAGAYWAATLACGLAAAGAGRGAAHRAWGRRDHP